MKQKKFLLVLIISLVGLSLVFSGCDDSSDGDKGVKVGYSAEDLISEFDGTWEITSQSIISDLTKDVPASTDTTILFPHDGTLIDLDAAADSTTGKMDYEVVALPVYGYFQFASGTMNIFLKVTDNADILTQYAAGSGTPAVGAGLDAYLKSVNPALSFDFTKMKAIAVNGKSDGTIDASTFFTQSLTVPAKDNIYSLLDLTSPTIVAVDSTDKEFTALGFLGITISYSLNEAGDELTFLIKIDGNGDGKWETAGYDQKIQMKLAKVTDAAFITSLTTATKSTNIVQSAIFSTTYYQGFGTTPFSTVLSNSAGALYQAGKYN